jgi:hypothetical protein
VPSGKRNGRALQHLAFVLLIGCAISGHAQQPSARSTPCVTLQPVPGPLGYADPLEGARFSISYAESRKSTAEEVRKRLAERGAVFVKDKRWQMLKPCDVTTSPQDDALSDAVRNEVVSMVLGKVGQWTSTSLSEREFTVTLGTECEIK